MKADKLADEIKNGDYDYISDKEQPIIVFPGEMKQDIISCLYELSKLRKKLSKPRH